MRAFKLNLYYFKNIWKGNYVYIIIAISISIILSISPAFMNLLIKTVLDSASGAVNSDRLILIVCTFVIYSAILALINAWYENVYSPKNIELLKGTVLGKIFDKSITIDLKKYDNFEFLNKYQFVLTNSVSSAIRTAGLLTGVVHSLFEIVFLIMLMFSMNRVIVVLAIAVAIINYYINYEVVKCSYKLSKCNVPYDRHVEYAVRIYYLSEYRKDLRLTYLPRVIQGIYKKGIDGVKNNISVIGAKKARLEIFQNVFIIATTVAILMYLSNSLRAGVIGAGSFIALFNGFTQLSSSIGNLIGVAPEAYSNSLYIEDFKEFMETVESVTGCERIDDFKFLELDGVSFSYDGITDVLKDISLKIKSGERIGIVGLNGAGKSTLAYILLGLYKRTAGEYRINGRLFDEYDFGDIKNSFGYLEQKFNIYGFSLRDNILLGSANSVSDEYIRNEMIAFGLGYKLDVADLNSYMTNELDESGIYLSGGEAQRLAIIRTLTKKYGLIVLDEPSSALDYYSEREVYDSVMSRNNSAAVVVISHKLVNLRDMDRIYYLDRGRIVEYGTHDELIKNGGAYCELYSQQAKQYD